MTKTALTEREKTAVLTMIDLNVESTPMPDVKYLIRAGNKLAARWHRVIRWEVARDD